MEQVKAKRVITTHSLKSYEHMLERMRKDEIKHQLRRNDLERHLYLLEKEYRELDIKMC